MKPICVRRQGKASELQGERRLWKHAGASVMQPVYSSLPSLLLSLVQRANQFQSILHLFACTRSRVADERRKEWGECCDTRSLAASRLPLSLRLLSIHSFTCSHSQRLSFTRSPVQRQSSRSSSSGSSSSSSYSSVSCSQVARETGNEETNATSMLLEWSRLCVRERDRLWRETREKGHQRKRDNRRKLACFSLSLSLLRHQRRNTAFPHLHENSRTALSSRSEGMKRKEGLT